MSNPVARIKWRPSRVGVISGSLVILGFLLTEVNWGFLALSAVGTFGPGMLREMGWLRDKDEFQRRAAYRAGYHAYIITGFVAFLFIAYVRSGDRTLKNAEELSTFYLALLWFTWMFSSLTSYWGAHKTAFRILIIFGSGWGVFNILGDLAHPVAMIMQLLVTTSPFFILAYASRRWPRVAGAVLLVASIFFVWFIHRFQPPQQSFVVSAGVLVLFVGPLFTSGLALLGSRDPEAEVQPAT